MLYQYEWLSLVNDGLVINRPLMRFASAAPGCTKLKTEFPSNCHAITKSV